MSDDLDQWEGWDDPLKEVAQFISAIPSRRIAEELYRVFLREIAVDRMRSDGVDPMDVTVNRRYFADHNQELTQLARIRLLEWCASVASQEG